MNWTKRIAFLACLIVPLLYPGRSVAKESADFENARGSRISWARLKFPTTGYRKSTLGWFYHPSGDIIIVDWLRRNTTMNMKLEWNIADVDRLDQMTDFPLIFVSGKGAMDLTANQKANVREYLLRGGFLFVDDCVALHQVKEDLFFDSVVSLLRELFPGIELRRLSLNTHPVFSCYYRITRWEHLQGVNNGLWGAWYKGRLLALLNSSDLHCGWVEFHFSRKQREFALRMAANIYIYSMFN